MNILAHRGCWGKASEKNSRRSLNRALALGFGIETDLRDFKGEIIVSHDIPNSESLSFEQLLQDYCIHESKSVLGLNVKSDGQAALVSDLLKKHEVENYYFFDMSIPDSMDYISRGLNVYQRISEFESVNKLTEKANGFWLDSFTGETDFSASIEALAEFDKPICIVSEELHSRNKERQWGELYAIYRANDKLELAICTDMPEQAREFFNEFN